MRWAALLRAINAGVTLPMADLRAFLTGQGLRDVQTLLASGNAVFACDERDADTLAARLHSAAKSDLGMETAWYLRSHADLARIIADNPFGEAALDHPNHLQVHFARDPVDAVLVDAVAAIHDGPERLHAIGRELYVDYPEGIGRSKLPPAMAKLKLADGATARNWNTITKLAALTA